MSNSPHYPLQHVWDSINNREKNAWSQAQHDNLISDLEQNSWAQAQRIKLRATGELPPIRDLYPGEERETPGQQAKYHCEPTLLAPNHPMLSGETPNLGGMDPEQRAVYEQSLKTKREYQQMVTSNKEKLTKRAVMEDYVQHRMPAATNYQGEIPRLTFSDVDSDKNAALSDLPFSTPKRSESSAGKNEFNKQRMEPAGRRMSSKFLPLMNKSESSLPLIGRGQIERPGPLSLLSGGVAARMKPPQAVLGSGNLIPSSTGVLAASGVVCIEPGNRVVSQHALIVGEGAQPPDDHPDSSAGLYTPSVYNADVWANDPRVGTTLPPFSPMPAPDANANKRDAGSQTASTLEASTVQILPSADHAVMRSVVKDILDEHTKTSEAMMKNWFGMLTSRIDNAEESVLERVDQMVARSTAFEKTVIDSLMDRSYASEQSLLERLDQLQASIITRQQQTDSTLLMRHHQADMTATQQRTSVRDSMMQPLTAINARIGRLEQLKFGQGFQQESDMLISQQAVRPSSVPRQHQSGQIYHQHSGMMMGQQAMRPSSAPEPAVFRTSLGRPSMTTDEGSPIQPSARLSKVNSSARDILMKSRGAEPDRIDSSQGFSIITNMQPNTQAPASANAASHQPPSAADLIASAFHGVETVTTVQRAAQDGESTPLVFNMEDGSQYVMPDIVRDAFSL